MKKNIRWGILGCGNIAQKFASDLQYVQRATIYAVASKNEEKGKLFAKKHDAKKVYNNYENLAKDDDVDIVYIATTHNFHYPNTLLCLNANKPVLCEKPLCINSKEAGHLIDIAKRRKIFLMEAMWMMFFPAINQLKKDLKKGIIGKPKLVQADFGINKPPNKGSRFYEKKLGAGSLLDLGVYTINFSNYIFDSHPTNINAYSKLTKQGIDEYTSCNFEYKNGEIAQLSSSVSFETKHQARIYGDKGKIVVDDFFHPKKYTVFLLSGNNTTTQKPFQGFGYQFEAIEAQNCLLNNLLQSEKFPLNKSLKVLKIMDKIRKKVGVVYPNDK